MKLLLLTACALAAILSSKVEWLSATEYDFGDLPQGVPATADFPFRNISGDVLTIDNVRTACSCTTPDWSEQIVFPGDSSTIRITYDARKTGYFRKKITVFFTGQRQSEKLYISGYVE
ncbi:MAG: DUF1573 domain-containing protein [Saprospiraceae bacterium]